MMKMATAPEPLGLALAEAGQAAGGGGAAMAADDAAAVAEAAAVVDVPAPPSGHVHWQEPTAASAAADAVAAVSAPQSKAPSSVFAGVSWDKASKKWNATIWHAGKTMYVASSRHFLSHSSCRHIGSYSDEADAARAVDRGYTERERPAVNTGVLAATQEGACKAPSSIFSGVRWDKASKKWMAYIGHAGKQMYVASSHRLPVSPLLQNYRVLQRRGGRCSSG